MVSRNTLDASTCVARIEADVTAERDPTEHVLMLASQLQDGAYPRAMVLDLLESSNATARWIACALCEAAPVCAWPLPLMEALGDVDPLVRRAATRALVRHGSDVPSVLLRLIALGADVDPSVRVVALAGVCTLAPTPTALERLAEQCVPDRFGHAAHAMDLLVFTSSRDAFAAAAQTLLSQRHTSLLQRGVLEVVHAAQVATDVLDDSLVRLGASGNDTFVRRAAMRALGRIEHPSRQVLHALTDVREDWDVMLAATAAISLGQLSVRSEMGVGLFQRRLRALGPHGVPYVASALRAAREPLPVDAVVLEAMRETQRHNRLNLADAVVGTLRGRLLAPGVWTEGMRLPMGPGRLDQLADLDALEGRTRSELVTVLDALETHPRALVRGAAIVLRTAFSRGLLAAVYLQERSERDENEWVRALALRCMESL